MSMPATDEQELDVLFFLQALDRIEKRRVIVRATQVARVRDHELSGEPPRGAQSVVGVRDRDDRLAVRPIGYDCDALVGQSPCCAPIRPCDRR
jgi:hypothetical protein